MRCCGRGRFGLTAAAAAACGAAAGEPMRGPRLAEERPIAIRGGVMMAALAAEVEGYGWPDALVLELEDGRAVRGTVGWVHPDPAAGGLDPTGWTDDPRGLAVRKIAPVDDTSLPATGSAYLLAALPADAGPSLRLGRQVVNPRWLEPDGPPIGRALGPGEGGADRDAPDQPDPDSPFERWRYAVLARGPGRSAPPPLPGDEAAQLVADHYAGLWSAGLSRLESLNAVVYRDALDLLTRRAMDGFLPVAAWSARPDAMRRLLEILADPQRSERQVVVESRRWCDEQSLLAMRLPASEETIVLVGVVNGRMRAIPGRFVWLGRLDDAATVELGANALCRVPVPRSALTPAAEGAGAAVSVLQIIAGEQSAQLTFPERAIPARPPGVTFALRPALTLAEAQSGWQRGVAPQRSTQVQVRRLAGRWEIFVECRRPGGPAAPGELSPWLERMRGVEAVTLFLGGQPAAVQLTVPETGPWRVWLGADSGTLEVHRRSYPEAWFCRVSLPASWMSNAEGAGRVLVGAVRSHGDGRALETGPYAALPWEPDPGRAIIDTSAWDGNGEP